MKKARYFTKQKPTNIIELNDNKLYVFICLNETYGVYENNEQTNSEEYVEYDYNEFVVNKDSVDVEDIENKTRNAKVAERSLVILNRDRDEQDINHTVNQLEIGFQKGDFQSVYSQANSLYKNRHLDNEN